MNLCFSLSLALALLQEEGTPPPPPDPPVQETTGESAPPETEPAVEAIAEAQPSASDLPAMVDLLPANVLGHLEISGLDELIASGRGSSLWALAHEEEVQKFFAPMFEGFEENLHYMLFEAEDKPDFNEPEKIEAWLAQPSFGRITATLLDVRDDEPALVVSADFGDQAADLFAMLKAAVMEEEDNDFVEGEVHGRPMLRDPREDVEGYTGEFVLDGSRIILSTGAEIPERMFAEGGDRLATADWYQGSMEQLGLESPLLFLAVDLESAISQAMEAVDEVGDMFDDIDDPEFREEFEKTQEYSQRSFAESPALQSMKGLAVGWAVQGKEMVERWSLLAPGDRSSWVASGTFQGVPEEHLALADQKADLFLTTSYDLQRLFEIADEDRARSRRIAKEIGMSEEDIPEDLLDAVENLKEMSGFDLRAKLAPVIGHRASLWLDMPMGLTGIPATAMIIDVKDPEGFDALLDELVAADEKLEEVTFTDNEYKGTRLVSVNLLNAGVPVIPTIARIDGQMMITLTPQAMKSAILNKGRDKHLGASDRLQPLRDYVGQGEYGMIGWVDMPAVIGFGYTALSGVLGLVGAQAAELPVDIDFALLPSAQTVIQHFGPALMSMREGPQGYRVDGTSTLGNPLTGTLAVGGGVAGAVAAAVGLEESVRNDKQQGAEAQMVQLALAMKAYKDSVGGGQWADNVVLLVDRGILLEADKLVDPADPKPKKVRSGTGERLPVSYTIGSPEALDEYTRRQLGEGVEKILYTRGAWYQVFGEPGHLVVGLGSEEPEVIVVPEQSFGN